MARGLKRYGKRGWQVTYHAVTRWRERVRNSHRNVEGTRQEIVTAAKGGVLVPNRYAARWIPKWTAAKGGVLVPNRYAARWIPKWTGKRLDVRHRQNGVRYLYTPNAVMVLYSKRCIVTVFAPDEEDLASILVWKMMNVWV
jgi:hypothetical protein